MRATYQVWYAGRMQRFVFVWMVTWTSLAAADKAPPPKASPGGTPTRAMPCVMDDSTLEVDDSSPVLCWPKGCMKLDVSTGSVLAQSRPGSKVRWTDPRPAVSFDKVCLGTTCKKLGKKLAEAVAAEGAKKPGAPIDATTDLKAVIIGTEAWSVAADQRLKLKEPKWHGPPGQALTRVSVAGAWLVTEWSGCAGPCTQATIADSSGKSRGKGFAGGGEIWQLSSQFFAVTSEHADVHVFALATGKLVGTMAFVGDAGAHLDAVRTTDDELAVIYVKDHMSHVTEVKVEGAGISAPFTMHLPPCSP